MGGSVASGRVSIKPRLQGSRVAHGPMAGGGIRAGPASLIAPVDGAEPVAPGLGDGGALVPGAGGGLVPGAGGGLVPGAGGGLVPGDGGGLVPGAGGGLVPGDGGGRGAGDGVALVPG